VPFKRIRWFEYSSHKLSEGIHRSLAVLSFMGRSSQAPSGTITIVVKNASENNQKDATNPRSRLSNAPEARPT
jgi:hypothetical protein